MFTRCKYEDVHISLEMFTAVFLKIKENMEISFIALKTL